MIRTILAALSIAASTHAAAEVQTPETFFGFRIATDGELARYSRVLEYRQHLADGSDRVELEVLGETTLGNRYAFVTVHSAQNLARLDGVRR